MKNRYAILIISIFCLLISGCKKDFLNVTPLDQYSEEGVWKDPALIQSFVNNIYLGIPHGFSALMLSSCADESMAVWDWESSSVTKCLLTPSYLGIFDIGFWTSKMRYITWNNSFKQIRACNLFLDKIEGVKFDDQVLKDQLTGEVHFLRAYYYHQLTALYGGVPIIKQAYKLDDDFLAPRNTYDECIKFIVEECDKSATLLPATLTGANKGRASKSAALTLKSRTLLYAASDLANNTTWATGFSKPEILGYNGGDRNARWLAAKNAAKAVIDLNVNSLYKSNPGPGDNISTNYGEIFLLKETSEDIFVRFIQAQYENDWDNGNPGLFNGPNGWHNWGGNTPIGQLVDDYEMIDGTRFDWNNPVHKADPYKNRDPRFYASILYEGAKWRQRPADVKELDPNGIVQVGFYEKPGNVIKPGLDTKKSPIEDWNGTSTGYYLRKFIDPTVDAQYFKQEVPWRFMRYAEVILNYAEACIALGQEPEARTYLNMIRKRAGMPDIPATVTGQALIDKCRNERRIELAYEEHRYFDVRRWMIAPQVYTDAKAVNILYKLLPNNTTSATPTYSLSTVQQRAWKNSHYYLPIKLDEMNKNNKLIQNPLY
ncbi:MAG: RagB/SusD family nutrient uptake outer membrane protein [Mariniphaga sp.]|nr:RagB/SusD family nutrient uptake outer membrane protein [Mariniphaga sp.]